MCLFGGQPKAPVNPAPYSVDDAWKHVKMETTDPPSVTSTAATPPRSQVDLAAAPKPRLSATAGAITPRM